jgi:hypothetical protein
MDTKAATATRARLHRPRVSEVVARASSSSSPSSSPRLTIIRPSVARDVSSSSSSSSWSVSRQK